MVQGLCFHDLSVITESPKKDELLYFIQENKASPTAIHETKLSDYYKI